MFNIPQAQNFKVIEKHQYYTHEWAAIDCVCVALRESWHMFNKKVWSSVNFSLFPSQTSTNTNTFMLYNIMVDLSIWTELKGKKNEET